MKKTRKLLIILCTFVAAFFVGCEKEKELELPSFKVAFDADGGSTVETQDVEAGSKVVKPTDPTKEDAIFGGWFADNEFEKIWDFSKDIVVDKNITLYAKWTSQYTVVFDLKGGELTSSDTLKVEAGMVVTEPTDPTKEDGIFGGWFTDQEFATAWDFSTGVVDKNITLYAKWTSQYTVVFDLKGGELTSSDTLKVEANTLVTKPTDPTMENGTFLGWYTNETFEQKWDFEVNVVTESITLYANWTVDYIVIFDATDGEPTPPQQEVKEGETITEPTKVPTKDGYRFLGWYTEVDESGRIWDFKTTVFSGKTLYAKWAETVTITITFETNDGGEIEQQKVPVYEKVTKPKDPVKDGFIFVGWYTDEALSNMYDFERYVTENQTLYAKWADSSEEFVVTFLIVDPITWDAESKDTVVQAGSKLIAPEATKVEGYQFSYWMNTTTGDEWDFEKDVVSSIVSLQTKYAKLYYVEFDANGSSTVVEKQTVVEGNKITEPTGVTNGNKTLEGWYYSYSDKEEEMKWNFSNELDEYFMDAGATLTLTAEWVETVEVTFKNGDAVHDTKSVIQGNILPQPLPPTTPPSEGMTFIGWSSTADSQDDLWNFNDDLVEIATTLHAIWAAEERTYTVTFTLSKDDDAPYKTVPGIKHNEKITEPVENPTADNQKFEYWMYSTEDGEDKSFDIKSRITSDMHVYARWSNYHTVSFNTEGGSTAPADQKVLEYENIVKPSTNPTKEGYIFSYWEKEEGKTEKYRYEYDFRNGVNESFTLHAKWVEEGMVTVSYYDGKEDTPIHTEQVAIGETTKPFAAPEKDGMIFRGWLRNGVIWDFSSPIVENINFYSSYVDASIKVNVNFNTYGYNNNNWIIEGNIQSQEISMESLITEPTKPVSYTHTFMGWYTENVGGKKWDFANDKALTEYLVLYSRWEDPQADARLYEHIQDIRSRIDNQNLYTAESFNAYEKAIEDALLDIKNNSLTDEQVEEGIVTLNKAVANLAKKQIGDTKRIELTDGNALDGQGNLMLVGSSSKENPNGMSLSSYSYAQMQSLGESNYLRVSTYDAAGNSTSATTQAFGDDDMWTWIYGIESNPSQYEEGVTYIQIRVKESGATGKLILRADDTELTVPVKHYTYNQAKSILMSEMKKLPAVVDDLTYEHMKLVDNLQNLVSRLSSINSDTEVDAAREKLWDYEIYKVFIERDGSNAIFDGDAFTYKEVGSFPYGEYTQEWMFDSYDGTYYQYKSVINADGTYKDESRESQTKDENAEWEPEGSGTVLINPADDNTSSKHYIYLVESADDGSNPASRATKKKSSSPISKIIEKQKAAKQAARNRR